MKLKHFFPFLDWIPLLKDPKNLRSDILAGITVALVLVPQSMAYASLAGLPLYVGLYTAFIPIIVAGLFGSSYQMSTGPVTIVSLMTATALAPIAVSGTEGYILYASLLAIFTGIFYLLLGSLKMGILVDFLSLPVILGFTNAIALITISSQLPKILGISVAKGSNFFSYSYDLVVKIIEGVHMITFVFGTGAIFLMFLLAKYAQKIPRILVVLIISIVISYYIKDYNLGLAIVGNITNSLPEFSLPFINSEISYSLSFEQMVNFMIMAMIIGLIGFTESISVAKYVSTKTKQRLRPNRELIGQGLANISSGVFGGFGVAGSFSKTAVNVRSGAKTGFSSVVAGSIVGITIVFFTPYLYYLPKAILGAIIIVAVSHLIKIKPFINGYETDKNDVLIGLITFILTLLLSPSVELGILIGIILSLGVFIYRNMRPKLAKVSMYKDGILRDSDLFGLEESDHLSILRFDSNIFFANANHFEQTVLEHLSEKQKLKVIVFNMELVNHIDYTGQKTLITLIDRLKKSNINVYLTDLRIDVLKKISKNGMLEKIGEKRFFLTVEDAIDKIQSKYGKDIDLQPIKKYKPNKKTKPLLEKEIIKELKEIKN